MGRVLFLFLVCCHTISSTVDYIINGGFQLPVITPANVQYIGCPTNWTCNNSQMLGSQYNTNILYGQFVDMEYYGFSNLSQVIQLPYSGTCNLDYRQGFFPGWAGYNCTLQIWWNGVLMATKPKATVMGNLQRIIVRGVQGSNVLLLKQVGTADYAGSVIDNFSLVCIFDNELTNASSNYEKYILSITVMQSVSILLSFPLYVLPSSRYLYLFLSDMWMYNYDVKNYTGIMDDIFATITFIDNTKFQMLSIWTNFSNYKQYLHLQKYMQFTEQKFLENEGSSSALLDSNFYLFVFAGPQTIIVSILLYLMFLLIKDYKISQIIRPYYFIKTTIMQCLFEPNISYFAYVCLSHLQMSFSFWFYDKLSLLLTVLFFFCVTAFTLCFYYLLSEYLKKQSIYFHVKFYRRQSSYNLLTFKNLVRLFLRGFAFFFLRQFYDIEMLTLSFIQLLTVILTLIVNQKQRVYQCKAHFCLQTLYHFLHCALNLAFFSEYALDGQTSSAKQQILSYVLQTELIIIYLLIISTILSMLFDLFPLKKEKKGKNKQIQKIRKKILIKKRDDKLEIQESANILKSVNNYLQQKVEKVQITPQLKVKQLHDRLQVQVIKNRRLFPK